MGNKQSQLKHLSNEVSIDHFKIKNVIGVGAFGRVRVAVHRRTKQQYAIKYFMKDEVVQKKAMEGVIEERNILARMNYPFIVNLRFSFQDSTYAYMVLDLMDCDLALFMKGKQLSELCITQLTIMVLDTVLYLHKNDLVHRDIKPENILVDSKGYPALTDFNTCSRLKKGEKIEGIVGTQSYLAPEVFDGRYDHVVDFWAVGITLYVMLFGTKPYTEIKNSRPTKELYLVPINFNRPSHIPATSPLHDLCKKLLVKDPLHRLGHPDLEEKVMEHPVFKTVDLPALREKEGVLSHACQKPKLPDVLHIQGQILDGDGIVAEPKKYKDYYDKIFETHYKSFDYLKNSVTVA